MARGKPFIKGGTADQRKPRKKPTPLVLDGLVKNTGRPTTYDAKTYPKIVERLRLIMLTNEEIAVFFGVTVNTLHLWAGKYPLFNAAYARGGEICDAEVVLSLRHSAKGYSHPEEKVFLGPGGKVIVHKTTKHYPPNPASIGLWMSNRQKSRWKLKFVPDEGDDDPPEIIVTGGLPDD